MHARRPVEEPPLSQSNFFWLWFTGGCSVCQVASPCAICLAPNKINVLFVASSIRDSSMGSLWYQLSSGKLDIQEFRYLLTYFIYKHIYDYKFILQHNHHGPQKTQLGPLSKVESDSFCVAVLKSRQQEGCLPTCPISSDVVSYKPSGGDLAAQLVTAGFPCQAAAACVHFFQSYWKPDLFGSRCRECQAPATSWAWATAGQAWSHNPSGFTMSSQKREGLKLRGYRNKNNPAESFWATFLV